MPLTLITGPANAAKAGVVLGRFRARLASDPLLVVPTSADAEHYRRELAAGGVVFGGQVVTFARLAALIAQSAGVRRRLLGPVGRRRVIRVAIADARLGRLGASARTPGFVSAVAELLADLQRALITPERFTEALATWRRTEPAAARGSYPEELAALYGAYRARLDELGAADPEGLAWAALDALRRDPGAWNRRPVLFYGFDDLTRIEVDAVETLARHAEADVMVALPYEAGRAAFAAAAATMAEVEPLASAHEALADRAEHYTAQSRPALHHLERSLFESEPVERPPNGAIRLLEAGGERAEAELVAAEVLELLRHGLEPADIAVLVRGGPDAGVLLARALKEAGAPVTHAREIPLERTRLGAGVLAAARVALGGATAADVLTWLRTPGNAPDPRWVDVLERRILRAEATTAEDVRRLAERTGPAPAGPGPVASAHAAAPGVSAEEVSPAPSLGVSAAEAAPAAALGVSAGSESPFAPLDALATAAREGAAPFAEALAAHADALWMAPHRRAAAVLTPQEAVDAAVADRLRSAARELRELGELAGDAAAALEALDGVRVREPVAEGGILVTDPLAVRARRFRAVVICGLQEAAWPERPAPDPFLDDDARRSLALATRLVLPYREDALSRERALFYASVSRPEQVLLLSWRSSDEEGNPLQPSPFLQDVRACFTPELFEQRGRRLLADVTWAPRDAPTPRELQRALAASRPPAEDPPPLAAPTTRDVLDALAARDSEPARGLETFAACGVRWLVEQVLRPQPLEPDPEPMRVGSVRHAVLERTLVLLRERTSSARLAPDRVDAALDALRAAMAEHSSGVRGAAQRAAARRMHADLERYIRLECESGAGFEPERLEWRFGDAREGDEPVELAPGLRVTGRVDRVDVEPGTRAAVVRDYKGARAPAGATWERDGDLQAALYALAVRERLGVEPVAALYQPLAGPDLRPRGLVRDDVPGGYVNGDAVSPHDFAAQLDRLRAVAAEAARALRSGAIRACPETCSSRGCAHPGICRAAEPKPEEEAP